jgi:D-tyrosyl-tRNA(Tyr) deacylase
MIAVLQRVKRAAVRVDNKIVGECAQGLCVLLGVAKGDTEEDARALASKIIDLRIFTDENDKMNLSLRDICGQMLVVSNFTLLASYKKGKRPDYFAAAAPDEANRLYEYFCSLADAEVSHVGRGIFGADMEIEMLNNGPVTIVMDSNVLLKKNTSDGEKK